MKYRIESRKTISMTGLPFRVSMKDGASFKEIPALWQRTMESGAFKKLLESMPKNSAFSIAGVVTPDADERTREFTYFIAIENAADRSKLPAGCTDFSIPPSAWAIFEARGPIPQAIQEVWQKIYTDWPPISGYEQQAGYQIEVYPEGDTAAADYLCEVWIPVRKK